MRFVAAFTILLLLAGGVSPSPAVAGTWKMKIVDVQVQRTVMDAETGLPVEVAPGVLNVTVEYYDETAPSEVVRHTFTFDARVPYETMLDRMLTHGRIYIHVVEREEAARGYIGHVFDLN